MKWRRLALYDFQRHHRLAFNFGPGVTTIVGATDRGKSAVLRAIRWLAFNRPAGTAVIRHGAAYAKVTIFLDKFPVSRVRGKGKNLYRVNGQDLVAFGSDPPDTVRHILNVLPDSIQRQHDPLFWLSLGPTELAKRLNALTGFDRADILKAGLATRRRKVKAELEVYADQLAEVESKLALAKKLRPVFVAGKRERFSDQKYAELARSMADLAEIVASAVAGQKAMETGKILGDGAIRAIAAAERRKKLAGRRELLEQLIVDARQSKPAWLGKVLAAFAVWQTAREAFWRAYDRRGTVDAGITEHVTEGKAWRRARKRLKELAAKHPKCPLCGRSQS